MDPILISKYPNRYIYRSIQKDYASAQADGKSYTVRATKSKRCYKPSSTRPTRQLETSTANSWARIFRSNAKDTEPMRYLLSFDATKDYYIQKVNGNKINQTTWIMIGQYLYGSGSKSCIKPSSTNNYGHDWTLSDHNLPGQLVYLQKK